MRQIKKLLIANRGEIARRIMRTAHAMGISTVAIYEDEDKSSPYVREAHTAHYLPAGFLDQDRILEICRSESVDAIHPGYGFLSENSAFVARVEAAGLIFVGPSAAAMQRMGDKTAARLEAKAAGVPLLPGFEIDDAATLNASARSKLVLDIGLPVVLKAAAGGGGKAQAIISEASEINAAFERVLREAERLYKSRAFVIERYLERARHVEVQILGNADRVNFALFDRDCSAQRNNQKILEEAPAPNLPESLRKALHESAVRLANHVGYTNAGTMEYLYDTNREEFYFLEMNTRLQVEHTVTEAITGLDLVREQLRIAQGEKTEYGQVNQTGHAIEARICAEKSDGSYLPATGKIVKYVEPVGARVDSGVETGSTISGKYDNMIAKLIVHAESRERAIEELRAKLGEYRLLGIHTNIPLIQKILLDAKFLNVEHYTRYLQTEFMAPQVDAELAASMAAILHYEIERAANRIAYGTLAGFSNVRV